MLCKHCGALFRADATTCSSCGWPTDGSGPDGAASTRLDVQQQIEHAAGQVAGIIVEGASPGGIRAVSDQTVDTVEDGGMVVAVAGEAVRGDKAAGDVVHGDKITYVTPPVTGRITADRAPVFLAPPKPRFNLVGRSEVLKQLKQALLDANAPARACVLRGLPGAGKTALVVELAHDPQVCHWFADGVLWASLGRQPDLLSIAATWATALGVPAEAIAKLKKVDDRLAAVRTAIGDRQVLLVVDDAWGIEPALRLDLGGSRCRYVLTTRFPEVAVEFPDEGVVHVHELGVEDGLAVLAQFAPAAVREEPEEARLLVTAVGGLPLALVLIGKYLKRESYGDSQRRLKAALARLRSSEQRLSLADRAVERANSMLAGTPLSLLAVIGMSEDNLDAPARAALRALSVFPAKPNTFSELAGEAVAGTPIDCVYRLLDQGLLEAAGSGRYALHQTIADYAGAKLEGFDAHVRLAEFLRRYLDGREASYGEIDLERVNVFAALAWLERAAAERSAGEPARFWRLYADLTDGVADYLWARGYWTERLSLCQKAYAACRKLLDDPEGAGRNAYRLGWVYWQQRDLTAAQFWAAECQRAAEEAGLPEGSAMSKHLLGLVAMRRDDYGGAERHFLEALETTSPSRAGVGGRGSIMSELGHVYRLQGRLDEAERWYRRGVDENERANYLEGIAITKGYLAQTLHAAGRRDDALPLYLQALDGALTVGRQTTIARIQDGLTRLLLEKGEASKAQPYAAEALQIYRRLSMPKERDDLERLLRAHTF